MKKIRRTKAIEGTSIPGIINNGGQFFYINVEIYEDGMINCWELVDLKGLKTKLKNNWLSAMVPIGENITIHGLGSYKVEEANWRFNSKSYYKHIKNTIHIINPDFVNIYEVSNHEKKLREERKVMHSPKSTDFYVESELFYRTVVGNGFSVFMLNENITYLVDLIVYKNGQVAIYGLPNEVQFNMEKSKMLFEDGTFFTDFNFTRPITIYGMGEVELSKPIYASSIEEKYKELLDIHKKLNDEKSSLEKCREAYYLYLTNPSDFYRENLRESYELVPKHERIYLGDMDSRDWDYQRIIYRPNEKREV